MLGVKGRRSKPRRKDETRGLLESFWRRTTSEGQFPEHGHEVWTMAGLSCAITVMERIDGWLHEDGERGERVVAARLAAWYWILHKGTEGAGRDETAEKGSVDAEHAQVGYAGGGTP